MCIYESRVDAVTCFQSRQDSFPAGYIVGHVPHLTSGVTRSCRSYTLVGALLRAVYIVNYYSE